MSLAQAGIANARPNPQTFNNFADICPSNCEPEIIAEIDNPNFHQHYYFEQMTARGNPPPSPSPPLASAIPQHSVAPAQYV